MSAAEKLDADLRARGYHRQDESNVHNPKYTHDEWTLTVHYNYSYGVSYGRSRSRPTTLRAATIQHNSYPLDTTYGSGDGMPIIANRLQRPSKSSYARNDYQPLWDILEGDGAKPRTMRERILTLADDPATAVWLAAENAHRRHVRVLAHKKAVSAPLPITISKDEYDTLVRQLYDAARQLAVANGLTDLPALYDRAKVALDAIGDALTTIPTSDEATS